MSKIKVIEKNEGTKIEYEVTGNKICFDDDLTINLAKREEDSPVHIDVCHDIDGRLVIGASAGRSYVAELDIPAREYEYEEIDVPNENEEDESEEENEDGENAAAKKMTKRTPVPFDINKVTLSLWAID